MIKCFEDVCGCSCENEIEQFQSILSSETNFNISNHQLFHSNIGWFSDKEIAGYDHFLGDWKIDRFGIYFLWHKDSYCPVHDLFHMKCLYVGKGYIKNRIIEHFKKKNFSEEMLVYFTYLQLPNRKAKYLEQLILDIFNIPNNTSENSGKEKLCRYFNQSEVD